jgi:hypothetical protein
VAGVLRAFEAMGAKVVDYEMDYRLYRLSFDHPFDVSGTIAPDGTCLVGLSLATTSGALDLTFQTYLREAKGAQATLSIGEDVFEESPETIAPVLLELAKIVNLHLPAYFGWGDHELTLQQLESALRFDRVAALTWANLFGPEMVRRIGQERLKTLPTYQIQVFKQGVLCLLSPAPGLLPAEEVIARIEVEWPGCALPSS